MCPCSCTDGDFSIGVFDIPELVVSTISNTMHDSITLKSYVMVELLFSDL